MITKRIRRHFPRRAILFLFGSALLFFLLAWVSISVQATNAATTLYKAPLSSTQGTPTVDPTVTALQKENLEHGNNWFWAFGSTIITSAALLFGGLITVFRWFGDRRDAREKRDEEQKRWLEDREAEREKRDEERFQSVVAGLGNTNQTGQVGAAIMLRTFLHPGYEQFYSQAFDLAVAHLRLRAIKSDTPEPLDSLSQALITVFKESFPLARNQINQNSERLDAAHIQLDSAYLVQVDLKDAWMIRAFLRKAVLMNADLSKAILSETNFNEALFNGAKLNKAILIKASLSGADLFEANLSGADLSKADLSRAILFRADLSKADLSEADLSGADLSEADLSEADLSGADLSGADLSGANPQAASQLTKTKMQNVKGLAQNVLEMCKSKGAIIK